MIGYVGQYPSLKFWYGLPPEYMELYLHGHDIMLRHTGNYLLHDNHITVSFDSENLVIGWFLMCLK
jgi:hypothetical protein